jgi:hypothetical protein
MSNILDSQVLQKKNQWFTVRRLAAARQIPHPDWHTEIFLIIVRGCEICPAAAPASLKNVFAIPRRYPFASA